LSSYAGLKVSGRQAGKAGRQARQAGRQAGRQSVENSIK